MMNERWQRFYQPPASPLVRVGMVLAGIGILALSFMLGLFVLAIAMGMAVIGAVVLAVRRLFAGSPQVDEGKGPIEVEYRVIHRERRKHDPD